MQWPEFFPKGCPPSEARSSTGTVFRVVKEKEEVPLCYKHFMSYRESQPKRVWPPEITECCLCSVSVVTEYEDAIQTRLNLKNKIPRYKKVGLFIAKGVLTPDLGKMLHTPNHDENIYSHHDWWVPNGTDPSIIFEYCSVDPREQA